MEGYNLVADVKSRGCYKRVGYGCDKGGVLSTTGVIHLPPNMQVLRLYKSIFTVDTERLSENMIFEY